MQPLPMNEFIQQNLAEVGIEVEFEVVEWNTLINIWRAGAKSDQGRHGMNYTYFIRTVHRFIRHLQSNCAAQRHQLGLLLRSGDGQAVREGAQDVRLQATDHVLQKMHDKIVDEALFLIVTHDVNPRAMRTKVKGFVQAQNWFQDFSPITMK